MKTQLAKFGFSVNDNPQSSTLSIADQQNEPIEELLSEFGTGLNASTSHPKPKPVEAVSSSGPSGGSAGAVPHMFVQMDVQDDPASGETIVQLLHGKWPSADVEPKVERIPTKKMPDTAQVRYFNEPDAAIANRCASILRLDYANAKVVRIGLASPSGQLEVWLPKIKPGEAK